MINPGDKLICTNIKYKIDENDLILNLTINKIYTVNFINDDKQLVILDNDNNRIFLATENSEKYYLYPYHQWHKFFITLKELRKQKLQKLKYENR